MGDGGSWGNAPLCDDCWERQDPGREPVRLAARFKETCHRCDRVTTSGIYVRARVDHGG